MTMVDNNKRHYNGNDNRNNRDNKDNKNNSANNTNLSESQDSTKIALKEIYETLTIFLNDKASINLKEI